MLRIYEEYGGDIDGWARSSKPRLAQPITDGDWQLIDRLLQKSSLILSGFATPEFAAQIKVEIAAASEDEFVYKRLMELAKPAK
jgi:hypothetical protein